MQSFETLPRQPLAVAIAIFFCIVVFLTLGQYGITWDEPIAFTAGADYSSWIRHPSLESVDRYWQTNSEHPPLVKTLGGLFEIVFSSKLHLFNPYIAFRLAVLPFVFVMNYALFLVAAELFGNLVALFVTAGLSLLPHVFFLSHIAAFDYPVMVMWFLVIYTYTLGMRSQKWIYVASLVLGLALLTKINAFFLFGSLGFQWLYTQWSTIYEIFQKKEKEESNQFKSAISKIIPPFVIAPLTFFFLWPWLWHDTPHRIKDFLLFHVQHYRIPAYYFGTRYEQAPWHLPFVLAIVTVPALMVILALAGSFFCARRNKTIRNIVLFNCFYPLTLIAISPSKHDGVRLFLPAFPFLCLLAGFGLSKIQGILKQQRRHAWAAGAIIVLYFAIDLHSLIKTHPYEAAYFNEFVGWTEGAQEKGMELQYWCESYLDLLPWMNQHTGSVYWVPSADHIFPLYQRYGMLSKQIRFGKKEDSDYLILAARYSHYDEEMFDYYRNEKPIFFVGVSKTVIAGIYKIKNRNSTSTSP